MPYNLRKHNYIPKQIPELEDFIKIRMNTSNNSSQIILADIRSIRK